MNRKTLVGLIGILGIALTAGLALPFVNVLKEFIPEQLMVFRGFMTATIALILLGGTVGRVDGYTYCIAVTLPFATLGLFNGIRFWGAGPTMVLITATPIVNFGIGLFLKRRPTRAAVAGLMLLLGGVGLALWNGEWNKLGFEWALFGTVMNGILYEFFARAKAKSLQKCFYATVSMGLLGLALSLGQDVSWEPAYGPATALTLLGFAFVGGFLYWLANLLAFENLPVAEASVLAQLETPAVIIGESYFLGKHFTGIEWAGVAIALCGAAFLAAWLARQVEREQQTAKP